MLFLDRCKNLWDCEKVLSRQLADKTLIGEAQLEAEDIGKLGRLFSHMDSPRELWRQFPNCAACFTTGIFSHFYDGEYWPHFREHYSRVVASDESCWREEFENFLLNNGMPCFHHVDGQRFLRHVRVHALIPAKGVARLFEHVVRPAVSRGLDDGEWTAAEVLRELGVSYPKLHRPEEDFLNYGGHVADDVLGRCMTLYRRSMQRSAEDDTLDLPHWLVDAFRKWMKGQSLHHTQSQPPAERPQVYLQLSLDSAALTLVVAQLPSEWRSGRTMSVYAEKGLDGSQLIIEQRIEVDPFVRQTETRFELPLETIAPRYRVEWRKAEDDCSTIERMRGFLGNGVLWAAFAASDPDNRLVRQQCVPRGEVWLVCPTNARVRTITTESEDPIPAQYLESFTLDGIGDMSARLIDTSRCFELVLEVDSGDDNGPPPEHIPVDVIPHIRLVGEVPGASIAGVSVCAQVPEVDCVDDDSDAIVEIEMLEGAGDRLLPPFVRASQLESTLKESWGVFRLRVRGRLGRRSTPVTVALIPDLQVCFKPALILPDHEGPTVVSVSAPHCQVIGAPKFIQPKISNQDSIVVDSDARRLDLQLVHVPPKGESWQFDLSIVVPRVLVGVKEPGSEPNLLPAVAKIPKRLLEKTPRVFLDLVIQPRPMGWRATLRADAIHAAVTQPAGRQTTSDRISFDLAMWRDALIHAKREVELRVDLDLAKLETVQGTLVARIASECRLLQAEAHCSLGSRSVTLRYAFDPTGPALGLHLVSTRYPWLPPREISTSERHRGEVKLPEMPPGKYAIEPAGGLCASTDIVPDLDGMKYLDLFTSEEERQTGWEEVLRTIARIWEETWQLRSGQWELSEKSADQADIEMDQYVRDKRGSQTRLRLRRDDLRHTLILMVYWGTQSVRCRQSTSVQYWERAVKLTFRLLQEYSCETNLSTKLAECLNELKQEASPKTREICRRLQGMLISYFQRH